MSREITTAMADALVAPTVTPILLFELEFSTVQYLWTGVGKLTWNGQDYLGLGRFIEISPVEETDKIEARGFTIKLAGARPEDVALALTEMQTRKPGVVRLGFLDDNGALIASPKVWSRGRLDIGKVDDSDTANPLIVLQYENELIDLERPREWRYTDEHQKLLHGGDASLRYIASYADKVIYWGRG